MSSSYLAVGYECNHKCICCPLTTYDRLHKGLSYEEITEQMSRIKEDDGKHIVLSGGEPMLHPQFLDIVKLAAEKNFNITVLSNSSQCRNADFVNQLLGCIPIGMFNIVTAIHSSYPEIHDSITGIRGSLLETLEGLDNLVAAGIPITVKHIFNKKSIDTLADTFHYLEQHFPPTVAFQFCTMDYCGRANKNIKELFITMKEIQPHIEEVLDYLEQNRTVVRIVEIIESPLCMTDPYYWKYYEGPGKNLNSYIAPNNETREISFDVSSECQSNYPSCEKCDVRKHCSGTWKSAYQYYGKELLQPIQAELIK